MADPRFTMSLRVRHASRTVQQIEEGLGLTVKVGHNVGGARRTPQGEPLEGTDRETFCVFSLIERQSGAFTDGLRVALDSLQPHRPYLVGVSDTGGRNEVHVGVFVDEGTSAGFTLDRDLTTRLTQLAIELSVDVYWD